MLRINCNSIRILLWVCLFIIGAFDNAVSAQSKPEVPNEYQVFFKHYVDKRSILDKALNLIDIELRDVGRSFALIAGVSQYPNMQFGRQYLNPAQEDIQKLQDYLKAYEFFDEIVVLENEHMTIENLQYFLQTYFPK